MNAQDLITFLEGLPANTEVFIELDDGVQSTNALQILYSSNFNWGTDSGPAVTFYADPPQKDSVDVEVDAVPAEPKVRRFTHVREFMDPNKAYLIFFGETGHFVYRNGLIHPTMFCRIETAINNVRDGLWKEITPEEATAMLK